ncbi:MAG: hypothetical protein EOP88_07465 [Verrucomicrobiaceae bacterium]|nr:MAG: hypothetical protein EOP88_07465 [Verrucomicrobiaceae bacterium]
MKTYRKITATTLMACAMAFTSPTLPAQAAEEETAPEAARAPAASATTKHLKLCAQLGLKVGRTYEFMLTGNEEVHYWQIRSLGESGWILAKDSRYPATWVNLSQVIAITPLINNAPSAERAKKPNREQR